MTIFEFTLFGIKIAPSYYGLMYAISFLIGYYIILKKKVISKESLDNLFLYIFFGVVLGGRIGYIIFYNFSYFLNNPFTIFKVWEGGMSFHGGALGVIIATFLFAKLNKESFLKIIDEITFVLPIGLFFGRIGNYLNKELLGFPYSGFLAVEKDGNLYFPSPLLEAFLEGIVLFLILFIVQKNRKFYGQISAYFLIFYGFFRIIVELFFRTPDPQIGYIFGFLTMGSILSLPMIIIGLILVFTLRKKYEINNN